MKGQAHAKDVKVDSGGEILGNVANIAEKVDEFRTHALPEKPSGATILDNCLARRDL
jgi:hypothetical protein